MGDQSSAEDSDRKEFKKIENRHRGENGNLSIRFRTNQKHNILNYVEGKLLQVEPSDCIDQVLLSICVKEIMWMGYEF